ncbi:MAG: hypothetical protein K5898_05215 [Ruminococcus sp.]|uniref:hypothetical protein n=1 Tax=Ruminococcus sp. TaxID=41978 RepID=UPI0025E29515|nr:hypothetical protein [Ruminococcus sp.]MCR4794557.1 hypothetical protein [Ruminococcus sp.]
MKAKRALLLSLALLTVSASFSCGKEKSKSEEKSEPETTTEAQETTEKKDKSGSGLDLSFGMMSYVEKSKKVSANSHAKSIYNSIMTVLVDEESKFGNDIVYTKTGEGDFGEKVRNYFPTDKEFEYIVILDETGYPKAVMCCSGTSRKDKVGVYGDIEDADDIRELKWKKVLDKFGLEYGKYTDIKLEDDDYGYNSNNNNSSYQEPEGYDFNDKELMESCDLAAAIAWEYNRGKEDIPVYLYGKWSKDAPFTSDLDWEIPEHGDIEYVLEYNGISVTKLFCWDTARDKKYVGDCDFGYGYTNFVDKTWDDVLEYYGYTQGEYRQY